MTDPEAIARIGHIAKKLGRRYCWEDKRELLSDGWIGYHDARARFDPQRGTKLWTFASARVRGAMLEGIRHRTKWYYGSRLSGRPWMIPGGIYPAPLVPDHAVLRRSLTAERPTREDSELRRQKARTLRSQGLSFPKIGAALGVSAQRAYQYLTEEGPCRTS